MASMHCDASNASLNVIWKRRYVWQIKSQISTIRDQREISLDENREELSLDASSGYQLLHRDTLPSEEDPGLTARR